MSESKAKLGTMQVGVILLAVATAAIHFSRAIADPEIRILFILNGLGYLGLVTLLYLPRFRHMQQRVRRVLIDYTALTIIAYIAWGLMSSDWVIPLGPLDKLLEVALIGLLWQEQRKLASSDELVVQKAAAHR